MPDSQVHNITNIEVCDNFHMTVTDTKAIDYQCLSSFRTAVQYLVSSIIQTKIGIMLSSDIKVIGHGECHKLAISAIPVVVGFVDALNDTNYSRRVTLDFKNKSDRK